MQEEIVAPGVASVTFNKPNHTEWKAVAQANARKIDHLGKRSKFLHKRTGKIGIIMFLS